MKKKLDEQTLTYFFSDSNFTIVYDIVKQNVLTKFNVSIDDTKDKNMLKREFMDTYKTNIHNLETIYDSIDKIKYLNKKVSENYLDKKHKLLKRINGNSTNDQLIKQTNNIQQSNTNKKSIEKTATDIIEEFKIARSKPKIINKETKKGIKEKEEQLIEKDEIGNEKLREIITYPKISNNLINKFKLNDKQRHIITIDSFLKDWRGKWVKTFNSEKRFESISLVKNDDYRYNYSINFTNLAGSNGIKVNRVFKNVSKIKILRMIIPSNENITQDFKTIVKNTKLEPYLIVNVKEFSNNQNITNTNIENDYSIINEWDTTRNSIFTRLYPSSTFSSSGIVNENMETVFLREKNVFLNRDNEEYVTDIGSLNKLSIAILRPGGYIYNNYKDDTLITGIDIFFKNVFFNRKQYDDNYVLNNTIAMNKRVYRDYNFVLTLSKPVHKEWFKQFDDILININFRDFLPKSNKLSDTEILDLENWFNKNKHNVIDSYLEDNMQQAYVYLRLDSNNMLNIGDKLVLGDTAFVIESQDSMVVPGELVFRLGEKYEDDTKLSVYETAINIINGINDPTNGLFYHASLYDVVEYDYDSYICVDTNDSFVEGDIIMGINSDAIGTVIKSETVTVDYEDLTKVYYTKNNGTFHKDELISDKVAKIISIDEDSSVITIEINSYFSFIPKLNETITGFSSNASGKVLSYNSNTKLLSYIKTKGTFLVNEKICVSNDSKKATITKLPLEKNNTFAWIKISINSVVGDSSDVNNRKIRYLEKTIHDENETFIESDKIKFFNQPYLDEKYAYSFDNAVFSNGSNFNTVYGNNYINKIIISGPNNINESNGNYYLNNESNQFNFIRIENDSNAYNENEKHLLDIKKWNFKNYLQFMTNKNTTIGTLINYNLQHTIVLEVETDSNQMRNQ